MVAAKTQFCHSTGDEGSFFGEGTAKALDQLHTHLKAETVTATTGPQLKSELFKQPTSARGKSHHEGLK